MFNIRWLLVLCLAAVAFSVPRGRDEWSDLVDSLREGLTTVKGRCWDKVLHMINHFMQDAAVSDALLYSGKYLNELGNFEVCIESPARRYILLIIDSYWLVMNLGLCTPSECLPSDYEGLRQPVATILTQLLQRLKPADMKLNLNVTKEQVHFVDSVQANANRSQVGIAAILILVVIFLFVLATLVATALNYCVHSVPDNRSPAPVQRAIDCFDIFRNLKVLIHGHERYEENVRVMFGVRFLALMWTMLAHAGFAARLAATANPGGYLASFTEQRSAYMYSATIAMDIFYYFTGFFLCYVLATPGRFSWRLYLHRLFRYYPTLLFTYLVYVYLLPPLANGPRYCQFLDTVDTVCSQLTPHILLFAYNFKPILQDCLTWSWYVAADMQFFVISAPLAFLLWRKPKLGSALVLGLMGVGYVITIWMALHYDIYAASSRYNDYYNKVYYAKPYSHIASYLLGMLLAKWYLGGKADEVNGRQDSLGQWLQRSRALRIVFYSVGAAGCLSLIQAPYWINKYADQNPRIVDLLYLVFARGAFACFATLFCMPIFVGKGSLLRSVLCNRTMAILSKLMYGMYMAHNLFREYFVSTMRVPLFYAQDENLIWFTSLSVLGYIGALFLFFFIEGPLFALENAFLVPSAAKS